MHPKLGLIIYSTLLSTVMGAYWVTLSWTVLGVSPHQDAVGRLLIIGCLCTLFTAPILGIIVDRAGFRKMSVIGQCLSMAAALIPSILTMLNSPLTTSYIYGMALLISISSIICIASFDRALKYSIAQTSIKKTRTLIAVFQQVAMMFGTAMSGLLISKYSEFYVFPIISLLVGLSIGVFLVATRNVLSDGLTFEAIQENHFTSFLSGVQHILNNKNLLIASLCIATAYASAQVINVSLPAFIKLELNQGSNLFGLCEALWALGGITTAMLLTTLVNRFELVWLPIISLAVLGVGMIFFAFLINPIFIMLACLIMGSLFSCSRTMADANLLSICSHEMIGRVRSNTMAVTSLIGISIYFIPIVVRNLLPSTLYLIVGIGTITIAICLVWLLYKKAT